MQQVSTKQCAHFEVPHTSSYIASALTAGLTLLGTAGPGAATRCPSRIDAYSSISNWRHDRPYSQMAAAGGDGAGRCCFFRIVHGAVSGAHLKTTGSAQCSAPVLISARANSGHRLLTWCTRLTPHRNYSFLRQLAICFNRISDIRCYLGFNNSPSDVLSS